MGLTTAPDAPRSADTRAAQTLASDLAAAGYTVEALEGLLGPVAAAALHREQAVPALRATAWAVEPGGRGGRAAADGRAAVLLRHFVLGQEVPRAALDAAVPGTGTHGLERLGLSSSAGRAAGDPVRPLVDLRPYAATDTDSDADSGPGATTAQHPGTGPGAGQWWLASDLGEMATRSALRADHVLGVGGASTTLAQSTIRSPRRRTLDLGTGCGIQALHAAAHSDAVVGTDVSARALAFAAFNAALAGVDVELRQGSMLEPVLARRDDGADDDDASDDGAGSFDLVVSNPPFVITPDPGPTGSRYEYRDAGGSGDDVVRDLVVRVGDVLAPGGVAQLLGNWEHRRGQDWTERVGAWVDESGLDAWVVQREVQDPAEYAELWLRDGGTTPERDPAGWADRYATWLDDFASRDVEAIGFGLVLLRRPERGPATLRRLEEHVGPVRQPLGAHLAAALAAHDALVGLDEAALADRRLTVAGDVTEERHLVPGAPDPTLVLLRQGGGLGRVVRAGTALAGLVGACDGELTVGQIVGGIGALLDVPADRLAAELLPQVRALIGDGLLTLDT